MDLRVDDHKKPIDELKRLYELHDLYLGPTLKKIKLDAATVKDIQQMLVHLGYYAGRAHGRLDEPTRRALQAYHSTENLEMRLTSEPDTIDAAVLDFMQQQCRRA
jgi:uncharacterized Ntn-hydrolase superfamily protein